MFFGVFQVGDLAGAQGQVVGGVIDHAVVRGVAYQSAFLAVQGFVDDVSGDQEGGAEQQRPLTGSRALLA